MYQLIQLSKSDNEAIVQEAGRCLGEIGPVDLSVGAMSSLPRSRTIASVMQEYEGNSLLHMYCHVFYLLDEYLMEPRYVEQHSFCICRSQQGAVTLQ